MYFPNDDTKKIVVERLEIQPNKSANQNSVKYERINLVLLLVLLVKKFNANLKMYFTKINRDKVKMTTW